MNINQEFSNKKYKDAFASEVSKLRSTGRTITSDSIYFGQIGSTQMEDIAYTDQLEIKRKIIVKIFKNILDKKLLKEFSVTSSPKIYEYRLKMEFVASYDPFHEPHSRFGQRKKSNFSWVIDMQECNLIDSEWFKKVRKVYDFLQENKVRNYDLIKQVGQLRYLTIKQYKNEAMLIITTRTYEDEKTINKAASIALESGFKSVYWVINDTATDTSEGKIESLYGEATIEIPIKDRRFKIGPENFFQNNIFCFEEIVKDVQIYLSKNDFSNCTLLDLYCGVGTLGILFQDFFKKVIGIDFSKENIKSAEANALINKSKNAEFFVKNLYSESIEEFNLLKNKCLIVDPPRTGLGKFNIEEINKFDPDTIIYISCNPVTQYNDLLLLLEKYTLELVKGYDMFPHTYHIESLVILKKKID